MNQSALSSPSPADRVFAGNRAHSATARKPPVDPRDRHLQRHMRQRLALAAALPPERRRNWAQKCLALARAQHRTAFYLMACLWLSTVGQIPAQELSIQAVAA